jgi:antitoxin VapB
MSLNIKNERTTQLARELAGLTGETMTEAITTALNERLERIRRSGRGDVASWLMDIAKTTAPLLKDLPPSDRIGELLYDDEMGLPK